eukprot:1779291-Heterocapsa_arctica.AAC.1
MQRTRRVCLARLGDAVVAEVPGDAAALLREDRSLHGLLDARMVLRPRPRRRAAQGRPGALGTQAVQPAALPLVQRPHPRERHRA